MPLALDILLAFILETRRPHQKLKVGCPRNLVGLEPFDMRRQPKAIPEGTADIFVVV